MQGKDKPTFAPHENSGDVVVVINARHVELTGRRWQKKMYKWHTGYTVPTTVMSVVKPVRLTGSIPHCCADHLTGLSCRYPGGLKERSAERVHEKDPGDVLRRAVNGMLPKNLLRKVSHTVCVFASMRL